MRVPAGEANRQARGPTEEVRTFDAVNDLATCDRPQYSGPGPLHLGFLDLNGGLGRSFGSLGLAIDTPALSIVASTGG